MSRQKRRNRQHQHVGLSPGTAVYVGEPREGGGALAAMVYDAQGLVEHKHPTPEEARAQVAHGRVVWLDCDGVHDVPLVTEICSRFGVHPLAIEDVLDTSTRTKLDLLDDGTLLVALEVLHVDDPCDVRTEHVTLVLGKGFVLSFQEHTGDRFDPVRQRIRSATGRIRSLGSDYLCYSLLDAIVDGYFLVLDRLDDRIETIEAEAIDGGADDLASRVYALKSDVTTVRRAVFPLREVVARLAKGEARLVSHSMEPYLRDLYDHVMSVLDMADANRERLTSVLELNLAIAAHRMNDVMKLLTVVATVFIPLSWLAGVYGMNFDPMPGSRSPYGFPLAVGVMVLLAVTMIAYFRFRRWL